MGSSEQATSAAHEPTTVVHSGFLNKLSGKGLLTSGSWKRRYCVLDARRLYFYDAKEDHQQLQPPQQPPQQPPPQEEATPTLAPPRQLQKTTNYVELQCCQSCDEANIKEVRKAANVFVISPADKGTLFDTGRIFLSADTPSDMKDWIEQIRTTIESRGGHAEPAEPTPQSKNRPDSGRALKTNELKCVKESPIVEEPSPTMAAESPAVDLSISSADIDHLVCVTKQRARGPVGRRLPRQRGPVHSVAEEIDRIGAGGGQQQRSESLPRIEAAGRVVTYHNRSFDLLSADGDVPAGAGSKGLRTVGVYAYSSSDDSLDVSLCEAASLRGVQRRPSSSALMSCPDEADNETCETLCETAPVVKLHSSTPSLSANPFQWSAPKNGHGNVNGAASTVWTPDVSFYWDSVPAPADGSVALSRALHSLHTQTLQLKSALAQLETDSSASRRDMGSLQENLTTVQNAAASVADKVAKMQVAVTSMERQIFHAVKEAQNLHQRANDALNAAFTAEKRFSQLEVDCQTLLNRLRNQRAAQADQAADRDVDVSSSPCISPMTPSGPSLLANSMNNNTSNNNNIFNGAVTFSPVAARAFAIPQTFDFAALLAKSSAASAAAVGPVVAHEMPKMKSSLRGEARSGSKSISFGPTTTFNAPPSPITDQQSSNPPANLIPDFNVAVATSTLKKSPSSSH